MYSTNLFGNCCLLICLLLILLFHPEELLAVDSEFDVSSENWNRHLQNMI
jgi:hypothetical protein